MVALLWLSSAPAQAQSWQVGFEQTRLADGTEVGIWYPTRGLERSQTIGIYTLSYVVGAQPIAGPLPLVVISHGSGGQNLGHHHTAHALASAGFVVAALTHPGDNYRDQSRATDLAARTAAVPVLIDFMLSDWRSDHPIDAGRIGAFGFSAGAFTVLAAAGATPDLSRVAQHCAQFPQAFECRLPGSGTPSSMPWTPVRDRRIRAIVAAAPALGYSFTRAGARAVRVPVQLWRAAQDRILESPHYVEPVRAALPGRPPIQLVPGAGHFDFLAPCAATAPALPICASGPQFDRASFHERFNRDVSAFFQRHLRPRQTRG